MSIPFILLQASSGGGMAQLVIFGAMMLVFWFFLIRPQSKRQREQMEFVNKIDKGDEVVTHSGIIGRISKIEGAAVTLEVGKVSLLVTKSSISKEMTDGYFADKNKV
ncbi:MAG: preprotein translocase subunit YajC [Saprospiraceae bacterium]